MHIAQKVILLLLSGIVTALILAAIELHFGGNIKYFTIPLNFIMGMITANYLYNKN